MNQLDPFAPKTASKPKKQKTKANNFIESLKELSSSLKQQSKDATVGVGQTAAEQLFGSTQNTPKTQSGELPVNQPFNFEEFMRSEERQAELKAKRSFENRFRQETMIFHRKEENAKLEIQAVQKELKQLAQETKELSAEVEKAVFQDMVEPGQYHLSFFERIKQTIIFARKKIADSKTWVQAFNNRKRRKQAHYWGQFKKSGTKFMLSQERYMSTQAG